MRETYAAGGRMNTARDERVRELHAQGLTDGSIDRQLGMSSGTARGIRRRLGLERNPLVSKSPGLEAMKAEAKPGTCICCDGLLPERSTSRARVICDDDDCRALYSRVWRSDRLARERVTRRAQVVR